MLFARAILERIGRGEVKVAYRRWWRPTVKAGTALPTAHGLLASKAVDPVADSTLTEPAARVSDSKT